MNEKGFTNKVGFDLKRKIKQDTCFNTFHHNSSKFHISIHKGIKPHGCPECLSTPFFDEQNIEITAVAGLHHFHSALKALQRHFWTPAEPLSDSVGVKFLTGFMAQTSVQNLFICDLSIYLFFFIQRLKYVFTCSTCLFKLIYIKSAFNVIPQRPLRFLICFERVLFT